MTEESTAEKAAEEKFSLPTFIGQKAGMTRIFDENGNHVPVTVIKLVPNYVSQVKTTDKEGYNAYQLAYYEKKPKNVNQPTKKKLEKAGIDKALARQTEVRLDEVSADNLGQAVNYDIFNDAQYVDVTSTSKGKGFQGVIKRYGFSGGPMTHGSKFHRTPGSVGMCNFPSKIHAQKKMPGQMGNKKVTVQNLKVVEVNPEKGYMLVKGSVPGGKNSFVRVSKALKR
jgi:large subunit ribosomal protein L3